MKFRNRPSAVFLGLSLIAVSAYPQLPQTASAPQPSTYKLIAPDLVAQGESFTGVVVEETDKGDVPLGAGDTVVFRGQVVPVEQGGKIALPAFTSELGNTFVATQVIRSSGAESQYIRPHHVEVMPANPNTPPRIAQVPSIISPGAPIRVTGQGLVALHRAALVGAAGRRIGLGEPVGSSLQQIYFAPKDLPKGTYHFIASDAGGKVYEAPGQCRNATLRLSSPRITHRGQRGEITILSDTDGTAILSGGEPQILIEQSVVDVRANAPARVAFTAQQLGDYTGKVLLVPPKDVPPPPGAPRVDARPEPVQARYDSTSRRTAVTAPVRVLDERGQPMANVPVDVALAHPNGVEYGRVTTDGSGRGNFLQWLSGEVASSALSAHVYRVLGHAWKQDPKTPCKDPTGIGFFYGLPKDCGLLSREHPGPKEKEPSGESVVATVLGYCDGECPGESGEVNKENKDQKAQQQLDQYLERLRKLYPKCTIKGKVKKSALRKGDSTKLIVSVDEMKMTKIPIVLPSWEDAVEIAGAYEALIKFTWATETRTGLDIEAEIEWECPELLICGREKMAADKGTCPVKFSATYCKRGENKKGECSIKKLGWPTGEEAPSEETLSGKKLSDALSAMQKLLPKMMKWLIGELCKCAS